VTARRRRALSGGAKICREKFSVTIAVGLGLADFPFSDAKAFWRWVDLCESGGVDSLWQTDRLVSRQPILECMSVMAALAGATQRIKFGMNVATLGLRDPLLLAKQCATIDVLSEGRLLPMFGIGNSRAPDWEATGRDTRGRGRRTNEGLELITRLWSEDSVDFDGEFYNYKGASISPRPVQKKLPLWLGGSSEAAIRRTARFGTGWQAGFETPDEAGVAIAAIKAAVAEQGRRIAPDHYGAGFAFRYGAWDDEPVRRIAEAYRARSGRDPRGAIVAGDTDAVMARIGDYVAAGVSKFILRPIGSDDADIMAQTQRLIDETLPAVKALNDRTAA
jgi:probable F420-dependent oxidoreductase